MLLLLQFFHSSKVALRVVSTRRESDESLMRLLCSRKEKVLCFKWRIWKWKQVGFKNYFRM